MLKPFKPKVREGENADFAATRSTSQSNAVLDGVAWVFAVDHLVFVKLSLNDKRLPLLCFR